MFLQSLSIAAMEKALSATWQRQQLINQNVANEDTPGYRAKRLDFETELNRQINLLRNSRNGSRKAGLEQIGRVEPQVYEDTSTIGRADGNNVDITAEQVEMTKVIYQFQALSQKVSGYYSTLKYAISGGR